MFGISLEHLMIVAVILVIFGPRRLPELGSYLGKGFKAYRDARDGVKNIPFRRQ